MNNRDWTNNASFSALSTEKQDILKEISAQLKGKSKSETLPFFIQTMNMLKNKNITFTTEETNLLIEQLSANLSPAEKTAFEALRRKLS